MSLYYFDDKCPGRSMSW